MGIPSVEYRLGQLQEAVDQLQENGYKASEDRKKQYEKLEQINLALQPIISDMPLMRRGLQQYQTDKITARRFIYAITALAATLGVTLSEFKAWIIHLWH